MRSGQTVVYQTGHRADLGRVAWRATRQGSSAPMVHRLANLEGTMATIGRYSKAYFVKDLRQYNGWCEAVSYLRQHIRKEEREEIVVERELVDNDILYVQEGFRVRDGIFTDENVVLGDVTPGWEDFCRDTLRFEVPADEDLEVKD